MVLLLLLLLLLLDGSVHTEVGLLLLDGSVHTEVGLLLLLDGSVRKRWVIIIIRWECS